MIRLRVVCAAALFGLAILPAAAADRPGTYVEAYAGRAPYYVVNHGPEISGPGIMITDIALTGTDLRRSYPYIGTYDDLTKVVSTRDDYTVLPAMLDPSVRPRTRGRAPWRRKPIKARRAR